MSLTEPDSKISLIRLFQKILKIPSQLLHQTAVWPTLNRKTYWRRYSNRPSTLHITAAQNFKLRWFALCNMPDSQRIHLSLPH